MLSKATSSEKGQLLNPGAREPQGKRTRSPNAPKVLVVRTIPRMRPRGRRWIEIKMPTARRTAGIMPPRCPGTRPGAWTTRIPSGRAARVPHAARLRSIPCPRVERPRATATDKLRQCRNTYGPEERDHCTGRQLLSARFRQAAQGEARMPTAVTQMVPHIVPCLQTRGRHSFLHTALSVTRREQRRASGT